MGRVNLKLFFVVYSVHVHVACILPFSTEIQCSLVTARIVDWLNTYNCLVLVHIIFFLLLPKRNIITFYGFIKELIYALPISVALGRE